MNRLVLRRTAIRRLAAFGLAGHSAFAAGLDARLTPEGVVVSAVGLPFLRGKALERLHDGGGVTADLLLSLSTSAVGSPVRRAVGRFVVSYDLWEEKFAVTRTLPSKRSVSRLAGAAAEAWCLENLPLAVDGIAPARDFWLKLEIRLDERKPQSAVRGDSGISLTGLVEIFSRTARAQQPNWLMEAGPLRLSNLKR